MRKVILFNMVTIDGFFTGPEGEIDWHNVDDEFNEFAREQLDSMEVLLFGRVTYQGMASYWPTDLAKTDDPIIAEKMNRKSKIVFSRTLEKAEWENTRLIKENIEEEINRLKRLPGNDLIIFGSANLASYLTNHGLIDEYRIIVNPLVLGKGQPLFKDLKVRLNLKLLKTKVFRSGNVLLYYSRENMQ
jgi:dihydrofolate reductase